MINWWISWYHEISFSEFELHYPWWISGHTDNTRLICAAVKAETEDDVRECIYKSYDKRPELIKFRFTEKKPCDWKPYCERFTKADWMSW